jgi:hypothetical protein
MAPDLIKSQSFLQACVDERQVRRFGSKLSGLDPQFLKWANDQYLALEASPVWPSVLSEVLNQFSLKPGLVLEFGVCTGTSTNLIAEQVAPKEVFGFDSFKGWPEDWTFGHLRVPKDFIAISSDTLPFNANVRLVKGFFSDTLPSFLTQNVGPASILHIDCDTFGSIEDIFRNIHPRLQVGTIIVFDEVLGDMGLENELKAFWSLLKEHPFSFEWLGRGGHCWTKDAEVVFNNVRRGGIVSDLRLAFANLGSILDVLSNRRPFDQVLSAAALRITSLP